MKLTREFIEMEIAASKAAIKTHEEGIAIHQIVMSAFEKELEKYPKPPKKPKV